MLFHYQPIVSEPPDGGDYLLILRPEIPIAVIGPSQSITLLGLVDTGSDNTILPKIVAEQLNIPLQNAHGPEATVFGGNRVRLLAGEVTLQIEADGESLRWSTPIYFFDFPKHHDETAILGHAGFLDYFTAVFDGKEGTLALLPNDDLPTV